MYARTGDSKFFEAAYHAAHFVRLHTKMDGPDAGIFTLKGADLKYVYPRAMHIHYLLTGDERCADAGKDHGGILSLNIRTRSISPSYHAQFRSASIPNAGEIFGRLDIRATDSLVFFMVGK